MSGNTENLLGLVQEKAGDARNANISILGENLVCYPALNPDLLPSWHFALQAC